MGGIESNCGTNLVLSENIKDFIISELLLLIATSILIIPLTTNPVNDKSICLLLVIEQLV